YRERGRFVVFRAKAVVLATGGIGRAFKITSNSWEYTGDGHTLAYDAGAELIDMEFEQFHPTGMNWPPSVRGILVTEGVRGEGGVRVDSDTQMSRLPCLFACCECAAGINGANRLGGNSLSDLIVLGKRAGEYAAKYAKDSPAGQVHADQIDAAAR